MKTTMRAAVAIALLAGDHPVGERVRRLLDAAPADLLGREGSWLLEPGRIVQAALWTKKDRWAVRFLVRWTDEQGTAREGLVRVLGEPPCTDLFETRRALEALLGGRLVLSAEKI